MNTRSDMPNRSKKALSAKKKTYFLFYFMMLPGLLYLLINNYLPMLGIFIAFKKIDFSLGVFKSPWVGFSNFKYLFATKDAFIITRNTLLYNGAFILLGIIFAVTAALMLNELISKTLLKIFQTSLTIPALISMVVISYLAFGFLSQEKGFLNNTVLPLFRMEEVSWYTTPSVWPFILVFIYIWKNIGLNSILYLSSIIGIDPSLFEAARIDGANKWQQITRITLPLIKPTIIVLTLMGIGRIFYSDFGLFYQVPMNSGYILNVTNTIDTYVYRGLMQLNNISMASAAGVYQSLVGFVLVLAANLIVKKVDKENALF